ncbi:glycosyltransferase [Nocardioides sp. S-58]|uniref:Glycosyltransferase n=1 Tax=Nocardioides renjunii TaxID=3095075 RepID=A0ABU5K8I0_9ACTN|nr:glycosyltransferase [Nocardioides sp. S-58]MDZ5661159.1 glycosyltransferase [Nocardioides sp. S-58]
MTPDPDGPLLSVVIPTRNRMATLVHSIANVLESGDDLEVVVHDTSDDPHAWDDVALRFRGEPRLRYAYTSPPQSFAETFDKAVSLARGRYVTIIGDDDGVLPQLLDCTRMIDRLGWEALTPSTPAAYNWPDFRHLYYGDADAGRLSVRPFTGEWEQVDVARELDRTARGGFQEFGRLPRIYYGVVRRDRLELLRERAGAHFVGTSPDISGAVGLATVVSRLVRLDYPVFLPGSSANSGAGRSGMKKHVGTLEDTPQTAAFAATWPDEVPPFYAVQTVWAQAALATLDALGETATKSHFGMARLHAQALVHNHHHRGTIMRSLRSNVARMSVARRVTTWATFGVAVGREVLVRARGLFYRVTKRGYYQHDHTQSDLPDIAAAGEALQQHLSGSHSDLPVIGPPH